MDRTLVERAQSGDRDAFSQLVKASTRRLFGLARLILRDPHRAEDAVQDAMLLAWRDLRALRDPDTWDPWVRRLTVNACYKAAGKHQRRTRIEVQVEADRRSAQAPDPANDIADREWVLSALDQLNLDQRAVIALHYYLDLPVVEVAEILDIPYGTAASRLTVSDPVIEDNVIEGGSIGIHITTGEPTPAGNRVCDNERNLVVRDDLVQEIGETNEICEDTTSG